MPAINQVANMRVDPNNGLRGVNGVASQKAERTPRLEPDEMNVSQAEAVRKALEDTPAVRAAEVARAKSLVQDKSYPPDVIIQKIASLLAIEMAGADPSVDSK
jgi:hypothetical protein